MKCKDVKPLLMGFLDDELTVEDRQLVEIHLSNCGECRNEMAAFQTIEEVATTMKFIEPSQQAWQGYWQNVYNRLERRIGWVLLSIGAILLMGFAGYEVLKELFSDPNIPWLVKIGISAFGLGMIVMIVSVVRERLTLKKFDKYEEVQQ